MNATTHCNTVSLAATSATELSQETRTSVKCFPFLPVNSRLWNSQLRVNYARKDVTPAQQQRPESPTVTLTWHASKYKVQGMGDSGLCCCVCVTSFARWLTPLFVDSAQAVRASFCFSLFPGASQNDTALPASAAQCQDVYLSCYPLPRPFVFI